MSTNISQPQLTTSSAIQIPTTIDYTSRDYAGLVSSMLLFAQQAMPDWNPTASEGDMGVMLMELWAYVGDILSYYTDRVGQEAYISTATQRLSLLNIAQLLGYTPSNGTPATGTVTFVTANPGVDIDVPAGTQVQTNFNSVTDQPVTYQVVTGGVCPGNGGVVTLNVQQGDTFNNVPIGTSTGLAGQTFTLPQTNVQDGSISIAIQTVGSNTTNTWVQVKSFVNSTSQDMVFTARVDANENSVITFGDGINGLIPGLGLQIFATFTTIVGAAGNCNAGVVNTLASNITGLSINLTPGGIAASSVMTGGADPESNDSIRANAPLTFQTQERAVSLDDFAALCLTVPGVSLANATANHSTSINLYFLGPNGAAPSTTLQNEVLEFFNGPPAKYLAGVTLSAPQPALISVDIGSANNVCTLVIYNTFSQLNVLNNVNVALQTLLSPPNTSFAQLLNVASVYHAIQSVPGVSYVTIPVITREDVPQNTTAAIQFRQSEVPIAGQFFFNVSGGQ
jgi:uncharacterized phage protein gp47/JayE